MEDHFWIDPLQLEKNAVDNTDSGGRRSRSVERSASEETLFKEDIIKAFLRSAQVAYGQAENVKNHMVDVQYPHLEPDSLSSHQYDFLKFSEEAIENTDTNLLEVLRHLQKFAVTLYQILKETEEVETGSDYHLLLQDSKDKMVQLLCDIMLAIEAFGMTPFEDIAYDTLPQHMKDKKRLSNKSLRDYLKKLERVIC
ncbi:hypothetical protein JTE90_007818 [Oedothorax gibbosus]|uniref:Uncharacterized protein n=1 Tax=Oedothorax gibbosus TaxID=931172 RepID=A0AAV6VIX8_9ARAC|nr:hypothetical protein JTE90_007818 [Oedothorax gibbosus]